MPSSDTGISFAEEISAAKQSELNLLTDEVDRAQARLMSLEREKVYFLFASQLFIYETVEMENLKTAVA